MNSNYFLDKLKFLPKTVTKTSEIKAAIQSKLNTLMPGRIKSKHNIFNTMLDVVYDTATLFMSYILTAAREQNIYVAQKTNSIRGLAQLTGHNGTRPISARGVVKINQVQVGLETEGDWFIFDQRTKFTNAENGIPYVVDSKEPIRYDANVGIKYVSLVEGTIKTQQFIATGVDLYTIHLDDNEYIENYWVNIKVNSEPFTRADSLRDMVVGDYEYFIRNGYSNQVDIQFGNDSHGVKLQEGDVVDVEYLVTNGEVGNVGTGSIFEIQGGVFDSEGEEVDINQYISCSSESGFDLGSNGENIEMTRSMTGYSSRSLTFPKPENLKAYLSRLSILSYVDAWRSDSDEKVFNIIAHPKLLLSSAVDYFYVPEDRFQLSTETKNNIITMIESSRRQMVSDEFIFQDITLKKYAMFVYIDGVVYDKQDFKTKILTTISDIMNAGVVGDEENIIARSGFINAFYDLPEVNRVSVNIISEDNENARISEQYIEESIELVGSAYIKRLDTIEVSSDENPNIGFTDIGDIKINKNEKALIRGDWYKYIGEDKTFLLNTEGVHIFLNNNDTWKEI